MKLINVKSFKPVAIDLFSGCGGLSLGLKHAGFAVAAAIEIDDRACETYRLNHKKTKLFNCDISNILGSELMKNLGLKLGELDLLAGCPPCQGFSTLKTKNTCYQIDDTRNNLIQEFSRLVEELLPKTVMLENVPNLRNDFRFHKFCIQLKKLGYQYSYDVLNVANFGVAQRRRRLILLASRVGPIDLAISTGECVTVRSVIGDLPDAGQSEDAMHDIKRIHSEKVLNIIKNIPKNGGSRKDLPDHLVLDCHKKSNGFGDVYGRLSWDKVSSTITSGCINPSKGRFIHPEYDRAITLREASLLQGFPIKYKFVSEHGMTANALMIGNALPPPFIKQHAEKLRKVISQ